MIPASMTPASMTPASMTPAVPSRDDAGTTRLARQCAGCGRSFAPTGRQRHCSTACRKRVFRARHAPYMTAAPPAAGTRREHTVYECPDCGDRQLGVQRCAGCALH